MSASGRRVRHPGTTMAMITGRGTEDVLPGVDEDPPEPLGIGVVVPFDFALDRELWWWAPGDAALYVTRTHRLDTPVSVDMALDLADPRALTQATADVLSASPHVVVYGCASASFVNGLTGERNLREAMEASGAPVARTASGAMLEAFKALGVQRIALATPYDAALTGRLGDFVEEAGYQVVSTSHLGMHSDIVRVRQRVVADLIREAHHPRADVIFVSCTNLPTFHLIAPLERELDVPALSSNLTLMWSAFRAVGAPGVPRPERLFARPAGRSSRVHDAVG